MRDLRPHLHSKQLLETNKGTFNTHTTVKAFLPLGPKAHELVTASPDFVTPASLDFSLAARENGHLEANPLKMAILPASHRKIACRGKKSAAVERGHSALHMKVPDPGRKLSTKLGEP